MIRSLAGDRRGATALIIALMSVPLIIASGAAVDFSRVASARAQMQLSVDAAALAGAGAYQVNNDGTAAYNVANTAFKSSSANLNGYAVLSSTVGTLCNPGGAPNIPCGTTSGSSGTTANCPPTTVYCVQVTAHAVLQNSLLAFVIPTDVLNVSSTAQTTGTNSLNPSGSSPGGASGSGILSHIGNGYGSDAVIDTITPLATDSAGNPIYGNPPAPNAYCSNANYGILQDLPTAPAATGVTTCNYVIIGTNTGTSGSTGSFSFSASDPLDFTLETFTGGNITSGTGDLDTTVFNPITGVSTNTGIPTHYTNELYVTNLLGATTYYPFGTILSGLALWASCPAHNLYGSINAYPNATSDLVPYQDSIHVFSSAWTVLGYPPTHGSNKPLLPFLGPANSLLGLVTVRAICPQWPTTGTSINPPTTSFSPGSLPSGYTPVANVSGFPTATNVPVYSTYYPDVTNSPGQGSATYPPAIAGCTPASNVSAGPWWGWSPPNNSRGDPAGATENPGGGAVTNCTSTIVTSPAGVTTTTSVLQSKTYNNCTFIIQPLGINVPNVNGIPDLPDYYTYLASPTAFPGVTGNPSGVISSQTLPLSGMTPVYDGVGNTHPAGYVPASVSITGSGPYTVTEPPAFGTDNYPPEDTSHQCYNPQANGINGTLLPGGLTNNDSPVTPIDPVENPQLGAIFCNSNPPQSYAVYWNDMGSYALPPQYNDDLGYANAFTEFTCPTPSNPGASGPPALVN